MCFPFAIPLAIAAISTAASAVGGYMQTKAQNQAAAYQYSQEQKQQQLVNQATIQNYNETLSRQRLDAQREGATQAQNAQAAILENQRRQATAVASGATAGITGQPLQSLFNDYQVAIGGVANNLQTNYSQLNENLFFNSGDAQRQAQARLNQAVPARPYMAQFSALPYLVKGAASLATSALGGLGGGSGSGAGNGLMSDSDVARHDQSASADAALSLG